LKLLVKATVSLLLIGYVFVLYKFGGLVATAGISVFIIGCLYEFYGLCDRLELKPLKWLGLLSSIFIIFEADKNNPKGMFYVILITVFIVFIKLILDKKHLNRAILDASITIFGLIYVAVLLSHLILVCKLPSLSQNRPPSGMDFFLFIVLSNAIGDMSANGIGRYLGKTKFLPHISPKKTVEGTLGGIFMAIITATITGFFIKFPLEHSIMAGICIGLSSVVGDYFESLLKRNAGVKDAGTLFVEHGGMLDRCDSLFLSSFVCYFYLNYFYYHINLFN